MLFFKIQNLKAQHRTEPQPSPSSPEAFLAKQNILNRHLMKCYMKVGDRVKFKKPKRNPRYGTLVHCEEDAGKVEWRNAGTVPLFLTIEVEKVHHKTGVIYGTEKVRAGVKQLIFSSH